MKNRRSAFSGKNVCLPLTNIQGTHVVKYRLFRTLLNHNHAALNSIAVMEQLYYSGKPFGLNPVRTAYEELLEAVYCVIYALEVISGRKYQDLARVAEEIDSAISKDLEPEVIYMTGDIILPFEKITVDLKKMVGGKAANLARIKNNLMPSGLWGILEQALRPAQCRPFGEVQGGVRGAETFASQAP